MTLVAFKKFVSLTRASKTHIITMKTIQRITLTLLLTIVALPMLAQKADDFREKANQGNKEAQCNLGLCYQQGVGTEKDMQQAIFWMEKAAQQDYALAQYCLGNIYLEQQNYEQAMLWLTKASNQYYGDADYQIGVMYSNGLGVEKDGEKTYYWLTKAAMHGCKDAKTILDGITLVKKQGSNGKYGFVNKNGEEQIPFEYDDVEPFSVEASSVWDYYSDEVYSSPATERVSVDAKKNGKWGLIDKANNILIPFEYDDHFKYAGKGLYHTSKNGKKGMIDEQNKVLIPFEYEDIEDFFDYLKVMKTKKWGLVARKGYKLALPCRYDKIESANKDYAVVRKGAKWGIVKVAANEQVVIPFNYDELNMFSQGLARAKKNGKWGFVDSNNKTIIPFEYEEASVFRSNGTASVKKQGKWSTIDKNNHIIESTMDLEEYY
jgi:hypothetical protein